MQNAVQSRLNLDPLQERPDHGGAGHDDEACSEERERNRRGENPVNRRRRHQPRHDHSEREQPRDHARSGVISAQVERQSALEKNDPDRQRDDRGENTLQTSRLDEIEALRPERNAAREEQDNGGNSDLAREQDEEKSASQRDDEAIEGRMSYEQVHLLQSQGELRSEPAGRLSTRPGKRKRVPHRNNFRNSSPSN